MEETVKLEDKKTVEVVDWDTVCSIHRTLCGVSVQDGKARSLLISDKRDEPYSNQVHLDGSVTYHVRRIRSGIEWTDALDALVGTDSTVQIFRKIAVNRWEALGPYRLESSKRREDDCYYLLKPQQT